MELYNEYIKPTIENLNDTILGLPKIYYLNMFQIKVFIMFLM
jgi:hypothetical protein